MSTLSVRAYNVGFGDALLVRIPDRDPRSGRETIRHLLIDVGNVQSGAGGDDTLFAPVIADIVRRLRGKAVDLYVMTHEHLDHVQGLYYANTVDAVAVEIDFAWLTASAEPGYGARHPTAERRLDAARAYLLEVERHLAASPQTVPTALAAMLANNHPRRTEPCVEHLRTIARRRTTYVHRECPLEAGVDHPFREARLRVLAPEEDTTAYYGRFRPRPLGATALDGPSGVSAAEALSAPAGVDPVAFAGLVESWRAGIGGNVLEIDRAANNTSVILELEWRGWRLLFAGDAEQRSWRTVEDQLRPVDLLKVAHHGSSNATPQEAILDRIFPRTRRPGRRRIAVLSTCPNTYNGVPDGDTIDRLRARGAEIVSTTSVPLGDSVVINLRAD
jgi:beta-lactamase superfamily II metal-dependent hydrolase